ncbi:MAG: alpha-mannosidase [Candidatus Aminicenantes bacterium]|nr:alpha-mannosidase [Candidatus Aminicenantes bacterium]
MNPAKKDIYERRARNFLARLRSMFYPEEILLAAEFCVYDPMVPFVRRDVGEFQPVTVGETWGKNWDRAWFFLQGRVPQEWKGREVCVRINLGGEGLVYDETGTPLQGLSVHTLWPNTDFRRDRFEITSNAQGGEAVSLWVEASAGQLFGLQINRDKGWKIPREFGSYTAVITDLVLAVFRRDIWHLYLDVLVLENLMRGLPGKSVRRARILHVLNKAIDVFRGDPGNVGMCRKILNQELDKKASASDLATTAVGHAHLDTAWLWPLSETVRKCGRTFASQVGLLERYSRYVFGASQAQHYAFVKKYYPSLYAKVKDLVAQGRWEVQGGMWVEADCNLISGESLVRQILHGKLFFLEEFGIDVDNLWLPDVFGYSAAFPQILRKSGINTFVTQKLSWNQFNRFPHHTFRWRGLDGSEVVTHFPPEDNYNSELQPEKLRGAAENFQEKAFLDEFLTLFGIGDGGGGPTAEMIEAGQRQENLEGCPRVSFGPAAAFLKKLEKQSGYLAVWAGELYFELHRGTYTSQAFNKKMNRRLELKLRELEILWSCLPLEHYPSQNLDDLWKTLLLNQFHDIIPGSSITPVYEECRRFYASMEQEVERLFQEAGEMLFVSDRDLVCLFNSLSVPFDRPLVLPESWAENEVLDESGHPVFQQVEAGKRVVLVEISALAARTLRRGERFPPVDQDLTGKPFVLENDLIRYAFSEKGTLSQILDKKNGREVLAGKREGNVLCLYEDRPVDWDAWDVDFYYEDALCGKAELMSWHWIADGPVRKGIRTEFRIGNSVIRQNIFLTAGNKRLDFETEVDWKENHKLLRVHFDLDIFTDAASFEIQFGRVFRPTHRNTSWDEARFEVVAHRYADLSSGEYGAALINNGKYGYRALGGDLSLSLLRAPTFPDPKADRGKHTFTYSFLPHTGRLEDSDVLKEAALLNQSAALFDGRDGKSFRFPVHVEGGAVLDTVKKAEREEALIFRLYEPLGKETVVRMKLDGESFRMFEADLMEHNLRELEAGEGEVNVTFHPFEIKTLKGIPGKMEGEGEKVKEKKGES